MKLPVTILDRLSDGGQDVASLVTSRHEVAGDSAMASRVTGRCIYRAS